jgi:hypothetical protein
MQVDGAVLDGLVEILDRMGSEQGDDGCGLLMRAEAGSVGLLALDGRHPREFLMGQVAPAEWLALGLVSWGWAAPPDQGRPSAHPDRQRARTVLAVDRAGGVAGRTHIAGGDTLDEAPEGSLVDCLRRVFGLSTSPASVGTEMLFATLWLGDILAVAGRSGRRLGWGEVAGLHPAVRMLAGLGREIGPDVLVPAARALATVYGWEDVRRQCIERSWLAKEVTPAEAAWMDSGMLSRWLLGGFAPMPVLVGQISEAVDDGAGRRVRRTLRQLGLTAS